MCYSGEKDYRSLYLVAVGSVEAISDTFYMADHALFLEEEDKNGSNTDSRPISKVQRMLPMREFYWTCNEATVGGKW